jgi:hypothetical protein
MEGFVLKEAKIGTRQGFEPQTYRLLWGYFGGFWSGLPQGRKRIPSIWP